jgi:hypothetical protein
VASSTNSYQPVPENYTLRGVKKRHPYQHAYATEQLPAYTRYLAISIPLLGTGAASSYTAVQY